MGRWSTRRKCSGAGKTCCVCARRCAIAELWPFMNRLMLKSHMAIYSWTLEYTYYHGAQGSSEIDLLGFDTDWFSWLANRGRTMEIFLIRIFHFHESMWLLFFRVVKIFDLTVYSCVKICGKHSGVNIFLYSWLAVRAKKAFKVKAVMEERTCERVQLRIEGLEKQDAKVQFMIFQGIYVF